ncbi:MAG: hypothetical protein G8D61_16830 [gamma proteobacterium symbiont of Ctena orbiculata]|nr:hypothetical protein [Candidatus Thiodiazotropha taylori]MBT3060035.1 hypothetical protein [Candidatus Thiodiazotropha sp. (ex Lucina pensylvanica)]MBV2093490.1 hypothetical protein [Candidatus Thiodiazotropha sp. (ex Codakia orbicularis)]PUB71876.1 MAG: hypothetical protein DBP03_19785 [gamma proteobacterium symbiont of Ctena orbiculata]MBT3062293.1 hypothetical protein [Candidatus Thiodiazotropha sp. (ex Lucina pensylvanica)]
MITRRKLASLALASTAATLFSVAPVATVQAGSEANVHCYGVNKCKGHNDCKTATNACKGMASCKGQGFVSMSKHACEEIGGSVDKPKE